MTTKKEIIDALINKLQETLGSTIEQSDMASNAAIDAPGRNESRYDSTKEEMGYLSNALSKKAYDIENIIKELINFSLPKKTNTLVLGLLVEIYMNNSNQLIFLVPGGGGQKIKIRDMSIITVSKNAPLYSALIDRKKDQTFLFNGGSIVIKDIK